MSRAVEVLVTGGAGFVGSNLVDRLVAGGHRVRILDSLARTGVEQNVARLLREHGDRVEFLHGDIQDVALLQRAVHQVRQVYHLAAQVAVTTSLADPLADFDVNARGTLQLLEAVRACHNPPALLFTSTNKVYGSLPDIALRPTASRYEPVDEALRRHGINEQRTIDLHSPYGCSKGAADQYVRDYARCYGLPTVVFRMSCIYGPHQLGTEDQGWVAHFLRQALAGATLTIYGDGLQVRDVLHVDDLLDAMQCAMQRIEAVQGDVYNIGGGPAHTLSLRELLALLAQEHGLQPPVRWASTRMGDQRYYVSNVGRFAMRTGWRPRVPVDRGLAGLLAWLRRNGDVVTAVAPVVTSTHSPSRSGAESGVGAAQAAEMVQ